MVRQKKGVEVFIYRITDKIEYLLLKRISSGIWSPITGGLEDDETLMDGVYREVYEELGITKNKILNIVKDTHYNIWEEAEGFGFGVQIPVNIQITFDKNIYPEHSDYRWLEYTEAINLLKWPKHKEGLTKLNSILKVD